MELAGRFPWLAFLSFRCVFDMAVFNLIFVRKFEGPILVPRTGGRKADAALGDFCPDARPDK